MSMNDPLILILWFVLSALYALLAIVDSRNAILDWRVARLADDDSRIIASMQVRTAFLRWISAAFNLAFFVLVMNGAVLSPISFVYVILLQLFLLCVDVGTALYDRYRLVKTP